jgi:signal transduction histidine kinase
MKAFFKKISDYNAVLTRIAAARIDKHKISYDLTGIFILLHYTFSFFIWPDHGNCPYTIFYIRIISAFFGISLLVRKNWNEQYAKQLPLFLYCALIYLSFSAFYMLFAERFSAPVGLNMAITLALLLILLDFISFLTVFLIGTFFAVVLLKFHSGVPLLPLCREYPVIAILSLGSFAGIFINQKNKRDRVDNLRDFSKVIAHEVRTPLSTALLLCKSVIHETTKEKSNIKKITSNIKKISRETQEVLMYIDTVLFKLNNFPKSSLNFEKFDIRKCLLTILEQYFPDEERKIISFGSDQNVIIKGNKHFVMHIFFYLLQILICQIKSFGKGEINIMLSESDTYNILSLKNTAFDAVSIERTELFSAENFSATALCAYFCKNVAEAMGGSVYCNTAEGKLAEFVLTFPKTTGDADS